MSQGRIHPCTDTNGTGRVVFFCMQVYRFSYTVFGCIELKIELNWTRNSKSKIKMNWLIIQILLFGCAQNLLFETKGVPNSKSCLDVQT
jgi:hypothetical protein